MDCPACGANGSVLEDDLLTVCTECHAMLEESQLVSAREFTESAAGT